MASPININANLNLNPASINASAKQVQQALGRITGQASEFQKSLDASTARVFAFGATTSVINGITQSFKSLVSATINVEAKLKEINSILGAGAAEFNKYRNSIFQVAKTTGQSFNTVAEGAAELARQGLGATESAKRLEAALILTRISGLGAEQSVKALTAAMNGFTSAGLTANQVVNKIVAVDTAFAVSAQDLAEGFSRAGSTAEDAGVSFNELLGLITAVEQRTARGGAVIGNAFKSIFTRLSRGSTIEDLKALGVAIDANQTGVQKLKALSDALQNISDPTVASQIKELAGGVFQINVVSAALKDIGDEASVFGQATKEAFNAANQATEKNAVLNETLLANLNSLIVSVTSLGEKIGNLTFGPLLQNLVGIATSFSESLDSALDPEKGSKFVQGLFKVIGGFISGPGLAIFTIAFAKIFKTVIKFAKEGFKTVMEIGSATERIKQIEGGLIGLLQKDEDLRNKLVSTTVTQAEKEQAVISAIQKENQLLTQQRDLVSEISNIARKGGVTGFDSKTGSFKGKKGRRYAAGGAGEMEPNLMTAMINEARDAPSGAMPYVTNFRGKPAVMNTSEMQVKIGGREEILTADQIPRFNKGSKAKERHRALNRDGTYIMLHGEKTGYKLNKFYMGPSPKNPSKAGKPTLSPTENNKTLVNVPTYGIPKDKKGIGDINDIIKKLGNTSVNEALRIAKAFSGGDMPDKNKAIIKREISSQINNGTHKAFAGNIQELALGSLLTDSAFDDYVAQGTGSTFDLNLEGQSKLKNLYKVRRHVAKTGEVKASGNNSLAGDAARKIFRVSKMGELTHSLKNEKGLTKSEFAKRYPNGVGPKGIKFKAVQTALFGKGKGVGKLPTLSQINAKFPTKSKGTISNSRLAAKTGISRFTKGSLPNLKVRRYNEGSMGIDPMMLMMMMGGMGSTLVGESGESSKRGSKDRRSEARKRLARIKRGRFTRTQLPTFRKAGQFLGKAPRTASFKGGFGLSIAGAAIGSQAGNVRDLTGSDKAGAFTEATGSITQFAAAGAAVAGPLGAAAGAAAGLAKSMFDSKKAIEEFDKQAQEFAKPDGSRFEAQKVQFDILGQGNDQTRKQLGKLASKTGIADLDISDQLIQAQKAFAATKKGTIQFVRAQKEYTKIAKRARKLIDNSNKIQTSLNTIRAAESRINQQRENNIGEKLGRDVAFQQKRIDLGQQLMVGKQGPFANLINRDLSIASKVGETTQAKALVEQIKTELAGATSLDEKEQLKQALSEASEEFKQKVSEGAIFMQQKQNEVGRLILENEKQKLALTKKSRELQTSDIVRAGKGDIFNLDIISNFKKALESIRGSNLTQDQKDVRIAELVTRLETSIGGISSGRQDFIRGLTSDLLTKGERSGAAGKSVIGGTAILRKDYLNAGGQGDINEGLKNNAEQLQALLAQQKAIEKQMQTYSQAFNAEKTIAAIKRTEATLNTAADNFAGYQAASEAIGGISDKVLTMAGNAEVAIETQNTRIETLVKIIEANREQIKKLTGGN